MVKLHIKLNFSCASSDRGVSFIIFTFYMGYRSIKWDSYLLNSFLRICFGDRIQLMKNMSTISLHLAICRCVSDIFVQENLFSGSHGVTKVLICWFSTLMVQPVSLAQLDVPSDWRPGGRGFNPRWGRKHSFVEIDHEIFSTVILSLLLIQEGQLSVSGERMCTIRTGWPLRGLSLPSKRVVK